MNAKYNFVFILNLLAVMVSGDPKFNQPIYVYQKMGLKSSE
jgi:hypothetical protein